MCSAMTRRGPRIGTRSSPGTIGAGGSSAGAAAGAGAGPRAGTGGVEGPEGGAGAGLAVVPEATEWTSASVIRPPGPVPRTWERSMPCSAAIRRTEGVARTRPAGPGDGVGAVVGADGVAEATGAGAGGVGADAAGAGDPPVSIVTRRPPTLTF